MTERQITVSEQTRGDVCATSAELLVEVRGEQFFRGEAALEKAREVQMLGRALSDLGLPSDAMRLAGLRAQVHTGLFTRSNVAAPWGGPHPPGALGR